MKTYTFKFNGRQSGAIGITYKISEGYKANDIHEAFSLLYEDYDSIRIERITENGKQIEAPKKINFINVRSNRERQRNLKNGQYL